MPSEEFGEEIGIHSENITVMVRTRPLNELERSRYGSEECMELDEKGASVKLKPSTSNMTTRIATTTGPYFFKYDYVLPGDCSQSRVFDIVGKSGCEHFLEGYNVAVFAYGQTGAGKTYTMYGDVMQIVSENNTIQVPEESGLVPRCLCHIFERVEAMKARGCTVDITVSFIEIYNEAVIDLLSTEARLLTVREDAIRDRTYVEGAIVAAVSNVQQVLNLLLRGAQNRTVGATAMNTESSRSHSVFTISLEAEEKDANDRRLVRQSKFELVDLAGSERQKYSRAEGRHLREASNINRSLTVLGKVIMALAAGSKHVPYRDSKLTFLLKNSIGGNSKTFLIANIGLSPRCQDESLSTLKFASFAKKPLMNVSKNVTNRDATVEDLRLEIFRLRQQLARGRMQSDGLLADTFTPNLSSGVERLIGESRMGGVNHPFDIEYTKKLELLLRQALERENDLRTKLNREKQQFRIKLDEYERLCKSLEQCLQSSKMIIKFKDLKLRDASTNATQDFSLDASQAASQVNPQMVRAAITIRSLQEELNSLRESDAQERAAERMALDMHVAELSGEVKILLDKVHELESTRSVVNSTDRDAIGIRNALLEKEDHILQLESQLQTVSISLEEERRAHISALELVQELREAEEGWIRTVEEMKRECNLTVERREKEHLARIDEIHRSVERKEALIQMLQQKTSTDKSSPGSPAEVFENKLGDEIIRMERQYEEELEAVRQELAHERQEKERVRTEQQELLQEKEEWRSTLQTLEMALDGSQRGYDEMQRRMEESFALAQDLEKALMEEQASHQQTKALLEQQEEGAARGTPKVEEERDKPSVEAEWIRRIGYQDRELRALKQELLETQRIVESQREEMKVLREAEEEWIRAIREAEGRMSSNMR